MEDVSFNFRNNVLFVPRNTNYTNYCDEDRHNEHCNYTGTKTMT